MNIKAAQQFAQQQYAGQTTQFPSMPTFGAEETLPPPVTYAIQSLEKAIAAASGNQEMLEQRFQNVCSPYPVKPMGPLPADAKSETTGCLLSDTLFELVRQVNALADRQESLSRACQL